MLFLPVLPGFGATDPEVVATFLGPFVRMPCQFLEEVAPLRWEPSRNLLALPVEDRTPHRREAAR